MKIFFLLLSLFWGSNIYAAEKLLQSCKPIAIEGDTIVLSAKKPRLILLHNLSKNNLWLTHVVTKPSASAGWSSRLQQGKWSAFALARPSFTLNCIESEPGHEQEVSCKGAISVCEWPLQNTSSVTKGGAFWASENVDFNDLVEQLTSRGFKLPNSSQEMVD